MKGDTNSSNHSSTGSYVTPDANAEGNCTISLPEGTYRGSYIDNGGIKVPHGYGVCDFTGGRYEGEFQEGVRSGRGRLIYSNGNIYEGQFKDNKKHGHGTFTWAKGEKYVGEFANDLRNGFGTFTWTSGNKYVGQFVNDMRCGTGVFTWPDGEVYEGQFENDSRTGYGCYKYVNGDRYEGDFLKGLRHGTGIYYYKNGDRYDGEFHEGKREGRGVLCFHNGNKYEGWFKDDKRHGKGVFYWASGSRYEGNFVCDQRTGHGIYNYYNGEKYEGYFKAGKKDGPGFFFAKDGTVAKEIWREGTNLTKTLLSIESIQYEREAMSIACEVPGTTKINGHLISNRLLLRIFSFLDAKSLCRAGSVSRTWKRLSDSEDLWKTLCVNRWKELVALSSKPTVRVWKSLYKWRSIYYNDQKPDGKNQFGTFLWENGNVYVGYLRSEAEGVRKLFSSKGSSSNESNIESKYEGKLTYVIVDNFDEGRTSKNRSGSKINLEKDGTGIMIYNNGDVYVGEWRNGKKEGHGIEVWTSGTKYEGSWRDGKRHGKGVMTYANGDLYQGEFVLNSKHGHGIYTTNGGLKYEGDWRDGNRHGFGTETDPQGNVVTSGQWVNGLMTEPPNLTSFRPDFEDKPPDGHRIQQWNQRRRAKQKLKGKGNSRHR